MLKEPGGRCAVVVPDGVLFGSSKAHVALRKALVESNQLDAVIALHNSVFRPYAGVSTAILIFHPRWHHRGCYFFYNVENDGYSKDDKRSKLKKTIPKMLLSAIQSIKKMHRQSPVHLMPESERCFLVTAKRSKTLNTTSASTAITSHPTRKFITSHLPTIWMNSREA